MLLGMTQHAADISRRVTVEDAAKLLGLSDNAIRKRIERGSLKSELVSGTRYVLLEADMSRPDTDMSQHAADMPAESGALISELRSRIEFLESELEERKQEIRLVIARHTEETRRKDHLLAAAIERIPAIEAPSEAPEAPEKPPDVPEKGTATEEERPPWWRFWR